MAVSGRSHQRLASSLAMVAALKAHPQTARRNPRDHAVGGQIARHRRAGGDRVGSFGEQPVLREFPRAGGGGPLQVVSNTSKKTAPPLWRDKPVYEWHSVILHKAPPALRI